MLAMCGPRSPTHMACLDLTQPRVWYDNRQTATGHDKC